MRDIEFRGKRKDNGEWVYGFYDHKPLTNRHLIHFYKGKKSDVGISCEVDPETVGQYTGLLDKNGAKIFEGDIMRVEHQGVYIGPVYYEEAQWFGAKDYLQRAVDDGAVVIGNIHDNPELLWAR